MKRYICLLIFAVFVGNAFASVPAPDRSIVFAEYDTLILAMDIYMPQDTAQLHKCMVFSYGGGFMTNNQKSPSVMEFCRRLADDGFVAVAIDYRLGLKGVVMKGLTGMIKPTENAIKMAVEDLYKAVGYILENAAELTVDPQMIILCGSSAGAMTSLQADYELCNRTELAAGFPEDFRFAGVISFAGAIFSRHGKCKYTIHDPAPTFFLHGTADRLVKYKKIQLFNLGLFGSDAIEKQFAKFGYPHKIMRFTGEGHGVAARYDTNYEDVIKFVDEFVVSKCNREVDETVWDRDRKPSSWDKSSPTDLYK